MGSGKNEHSDHPKAFFYFTNNSVFGGRGGRGSECCPVKKPENIIGVPSNPGRHCRTYELRPTEVTERFHEHVEIKLDLSNSPEISKKLAKKNLEENFSDKRHYNVGSRTNEADTESKGDVCSFESDKTLLQSIQYILEDNVEKPKNSRNRRASVPNKGSTEEYQNEDVGYRSKRVKSTPNAFAPLCVISNPKLRYLHGCASHVFMPHLGTETGRRRMSCPAPSIGPNELNAPQSGPTKKRRQSFPIERPKLGGRSAFHLHRCKGQITASASSLQPSQRKPSDVGADSFILTDEALDLTVEPLYLTDEPITDFPSCSDSPNPIARSIQLLEKWSASVLDGPVKNSSVSTLRRPETCMSNKPSLHSICEE